MYKDSILKMNIGIGTSIYFFLIPRFKKKCGVNLAHEMKFNNSIWKFISLSGDYWLCYSSILKYVKPGSFLKCTLYIVAGCD